MANYPWSPWPPPPAANSGSGGPALPGARLYFGASMSSEDAGSALVANGNPHEAAIASPGSAQAQVTSGFDQTFKTIAWSSQSADATTKLAVYINGVLLATFTLTNLSGVLPCNLLGVAADKFSVVFVEGTAPGSIVVSLSPDTGGTGPAGAPGAAGADGANGANAFTTVVASYVQPAVGANVTVSLVSSAWLVSGQIVFVQGGGYYGVVDPVTGELVNLGYVGNAAPGATVPASGGVSPGGVKGAAGAASFATYVAELAVNATGAGGIPPTGPLLALPPITLGPSTTRLLLTLTGSGLGNPATQAYALRLTDGTINKDIQIISGNVNGCLPFNYQCVMTGLVPGSTHTISSLFSAGASCNAGTTSTHYCTLTAQELA